MNSMHTETEAELVMANKRLVLKIANKLILQVQDPAIDIDDLISEGCIGLLECIRKNNGNPYSFRTYAYRTIIGQIRMFLDRNKSINVPAHIVALSKRVRFAGLESVEEVTERFGCTPETASNVLYYLRVQVDSTEKPVLASKRGGEVSTLGDITAGPQDDITYPLVEEFLSRLKPYERETVELRMMGFENVDIQRMQGLSHGAIRERLVRIRKKYDMYLNNIEPIDRRKKKSC